MRLAGLTIKRLKPTEKQVIYDDDALSGFGSRVSQGTKAFIPAYGKQRKRPAMGR